MPEISRFLGIVILMNFRDHPPPHFHAVYSEHEATYDISRLKRMAGHLPSRAERLMLEWASLHRQELMAIWEALRRLEAPKAIDPLE